MYHVRAGSVHTGQLASLSQLPALRSLSLTSCTLHSPALAPLSQLLQLEELRLDFKDRLGPRVSE